MHTKLLHATVKMGVLIFKVLIFISHTVQWHMMNPSESIFLSRIYIDPLPGFWMSVIHSIIQLFHFMQDSVSVHHHNICTSLKLLTQCSFQ